MICLRCGHCCRTMSPLGPSCKNLQFCGTVAGCKAYPTEAELVLPELGGDRRPKQCQDHEYEAYRVCPVGLDVLGDPNISARRAEVDNARF